MLEYPRDLPGDASDEVIAAERAHIVAHLSAVAASDDDPETNADDVDIVTTRRDDGQLRLTGYLDAERSAPYDDPDYDPFKDVDPELMQVVLDG